MASNAKSSEKNKPTNRTLFKFDRGPVQILDNLATLNKTEVVTLQLLFFALIEILSLKFTDNDPLKSRRLFQLLLDLLQQSKMLPISMSLSAKSIRHYDLFQTYVKVLQQSISSALMQIQSDSSVSDRSIIKNVLSNNFGPLLLPPKSPTSNISIDLPQPDFKLRIPLPLPINGTVAISGFGDAVVFRYVQDFYEIDKLGQGAFGSVYSARNRLDDRVYAIKKIIFSKNTERTRRQAQRALSEVRVLASLCHPNIIQYHCAWLELVPIKNHMPRTSSSSTSPPRVKKSIRQVQEYDSLDSLIQFEGQSGSPQKTNKENDETKSPQKSSTTSTDGDEDGSEGSIFASDSKNSNSRTEHGCHSDENHLSFSSKKSHKSFKSEDKTRSHDKYSTKELIPFQKHSQLVQSFIQPNYIDSKIVLFIQMQLCDLTLRDWLHYRDLSIIKETSDEKKTLFHSLNELGQRQCRHIFTQLLHAVQYLHSQSFVHRDIKPRNIFLAYDTKDPTYVHVKLGDFGLATLLDCESTSDLSEQIKNNESTVVGTALYAPPEQLNSYNSTTTPKSDSYSLGIVLFELFNIYPTEMERCRSLSDLRVNMKVEQSFLDLYPFESNVIEQLVLVESDKRPSVEHLLTVYAKEMQQRMKRRQNNSKQMIIEQLQEKLRDKDRRIQELEFELKQNKL